MNDWVAIALLVILLAGNAFFVAGEFEGAFNHAGVVFHGAFRG